MSTFSEFKDEILAHNASNQWVDSNTNANDIYWKLLYSNSGYINKIANYPDTDEIKTSLTKLSKIISALTKSSGFKIHINSGYRNKATNKVIGGVNNSQHSKGEAVDMDCGSMSTLDKAKLFLFLLNNESWKNKIDQLIWEKNGQWVHCSFKCTGNDISSDSSFSPRPYSSDRKILWMNPSGKYINIWTTQYKRNTDDGNYIFFDGVPGLTGVKYDGKSFDVDYSKITEVIGSGLSGNGDGIDYSGNSGGSYGSELSIKYGNSSNYAPNKVMNLSKARNRIDGTEPSLNENRKTDFDALANRLIEEAPALGRDITKSQEMYDTSILKGDQVSKRRIK